MADWGEGFQLTKWAGTKIERRKADKVASATSQSAEVGRAPKHHKNKLLGEMMEAECDDRCLTTTKI